MKSKKLQTDLKSNISVKAYRTHRFVTAHRVGLAYIERNKLLPQHQAVYCNGHSTETALLKVYSYILLTPSVVATLSYLACWTWVPFLSLLITAYSSSGLRQHNDIDGMNHQCIWSNLLDRSQTVVLNDVLFYSQPLARVVPQGSVFGPIIFMLYSTEIPEIVRTSNFEPHVCAYVTQLLLLYAHYRHTVSDTTSARVHWCHKAVDVLEQTEINSWHDRVCLVRLKSPS